MKKFFRQFANLQLAIFLLLLIAFFSALGSIIDQDKSLDFYIKNYPTLLFNRPIWTYLKFFSFDQIYSAWWFFLLLIIFGLCLFCCTFLQQFPALKFALRYYFYSYQSQLTSFDLSLLNRKLLKVRLAFDCLMKIIQFFKTTKAFIRIKD